MQYALIAYDLQLILALMGVLPLPIGDNNIAVIGRQIHALYGHVGVGHSSTLYKRHLLYSELTPWIAKRLQINAQRCKGDVAFHRPLFAFSLLWRWRCVC